MEDGGVIGFERELGVNVGAGDGSASGLTAGRWTGREVGADCGDRCRRCDGHDPEFCVGGAVGQFVDGFVICGGRLRALVRRELDADCTVCPDGDGEFASGDRVAVDCSEGVPSDLDGAGGGRAVGAVDGVRDGGELGYLCMGNPHTQHQ